MELPRFSARLDGNPLVYALHPNANPADGMRIHSGTRSLAGFIKATVNFPGVCVQVRK